MDAEWTHSAYRELKGERQRCRIINTPRLLNCLAMKDEETFRSWHERTLAEKLTVKNKREPYWSNSIAVGDREWLEQLVKSQQLKRHVIIDKEEGCYLQGMKGAFDKTNK